MILERATDELDVICNKSGSERVTGKSRVGPPIEGELQRSIAVDQPASQQAAHGAVSITSIAPAMAWVRVSRVTVSQERHPLAWYQSSKIGPAGFSRR